MPDIQIPEKFPSGKVPTWKGSHKYLILGESPHSTSELLQPIHWITTLCVACS